MAQAHAIPSPQGSPDPPLDRAALPFVVGVDTSSARLAVSLPKHKTFVLDVMGSPDERRRELFYGAREFFQGLPTGAWVVCEEPLGLAKNGRTTMILNLAAGAIWAAHLDLDLWWIWLGHSTWKRDIIGRGDAKKSDVRDFCEDNPAFKYEDREQFLIYPDLFDAFVIRLWGIRNLAQLGPSEIS